MTLIKHDQGLVEQERKRQASGRDDPPDSYTWHRQPGNMGVSGIRRLGSERTVENVHLGAYSGTTSALFGNAATSAVALSAGSMLPGWCHTHLWGGWSLQDGQPRAIAAANGAGRIQDGFGDMTISRWYMTSIHCNSPREED